MRFYKNQLCWIIASGSLLLDLITKDAVVKNLKIGQSWPIWTGVLHFTHAQNPGAAFSSNSGEWWLRWLSLLVSLGIVFFIWDSPRLKRLEQIAYGAILAGAVGNGIERFTRNCTVEINGVKKLTQCVTDFIDAQIVPFPSFNWIDKSVRITSFPIFNWADISINIGIIALLLHFFLMNREAPRKN